MNPLPEVVNVVVTQTPDVVVNLTTRSGNVSGSEFLLFAYHHNQGAAGTEWFVEHNLGFYPNVTTMDSAGSTVEGELAHLSKYSLRVTFSVPISGDAYLS